MPSLGQAGFAEKVQRAVNGRQSQVRIFSRELVIHLFRRDVLLLEKSVENQFALPSKFELMFPEMILQDSHFFGMFCHHDQTDLLDLELKTKRSSRVKSVLRASYKVELFDGCFPDCL